ncbi:unnamed protein product, partial [Polarella glacialis]
WKLERCQRAHVHRLVELAGAADVQVVQGTGSQGGGAKAKRIWREAVPSAPAENGFHTFKADALDHAETDVRAYMHLKPLLARLAQELSKKGPSELKLWDPYFCKGAMVKKLASLGFPKVHNVNEDFYAVAASGKLPDYDVLLSSPPYSGDHLERCLKFCVGSTKPWCLLLPIWVERKPYFSELLGEEAKRLIYIAPVNRYTYWMPSDLVKGDSKPAWVGADGGTSPYDSMWYCFLPKTMPQEKVFQMLEKLGGKEWILTRSVKAARWKLKKMGKGTGPRPGPPSSLGGLGLDQEPRGPRKEAGKRTKGKKQLQKQQQKASSSSQSLKKYKGTVTFD